MGSPRRLLSLAAATAVLLLATVLIFPALRDLAAGVLVASPFALIFVRFPNETKQAVGFVLSKLAGVKPWIERESVRQDLEGTLSRGAASLRDGCDSESIVTRFRIDYLTSGEDVHRLPDGTLVIGIAQHHDRVRNLVTAAWAFVRHGIIPQARPFIDSQVSQGLDFVLTKSLLGGTNRAAVADFLQRIWTPAATNESRLRSLTAKLERLDENQLLAPVLLSEFADLASRYGLRFPDQAMFDETAAFVDHMYDIATREPGDQVHGPTQFDGQLIKCRVVFVARPEVYAVKGPDPHRKAIDWAIRRAYHHVYLVASGRNVEYAPDVVAPYLRSDRILSVSEFRTKRRLPTGRVIDQLVCRLSVDVRYFASVGRHRLVAVGPGLPDLSRGARDASRRSA
jgi:hypothetical protein